MNRVKKGTMRLFRGVMFSTWAQHHFNCIPFAYTVCARAANINRKFVFLADLEEREEKMSLSLLVKKSIHCILESVCNVPPEVLDMSKKPVL